MLRRLFTSGNPSPLAAIRQHRAYSRGSPPANNHNNYNVSKSNTFRNEVRQLDRQSNRSIRARHADDTVDPTDHGAAEPDFQQLANTHLTHRTEALRERERIRHRTVGAKYFRTVNPNFLTWSEKEQMRRLHAGDPGEWTVDRLAEAYPADGETIAKLLRARWTPSSDKRIARHDESVRVAWQAFGAGEVGDMTDALREHLHKFTGRSVRVQDAVRGVAVAKVLPETPVKDDFMKILTSCKKFRGEQSPLQIGASSPLADAPKTVGRDDTFMLGGKGAVGRSKSMMFRELEVMNGREAPRKDGDGGVDVAIAAKHAHSPFRDPSAGTAAGDLAADDDDDTELTFSSHPKQESLQQQHVTKYQMADVQPSDAEFRRLSMPAIRDQITIPAKLWRRGATYKLADCYYDDDGEFLYRVPGMTGRRN